MGVGVAEVDRERLRAVLVAQRPEQRTDPVERLVPGRRVQRAVVPTHHRHPEPVGIVVQLPERDALGAHVATGERVLGVTAHRDHLLALEGDLQAAGGLAQRAGAPGRAAFAGIAHLSEPTWWRSRRHQNARRAPERPPIGSRP